MKNKTTSLLASFFVLLIFTTLVLPGRASPAALQAFFKLMASSTRQVLGTTASGPTHNTNRPTVTTQ